MPELFDGHLFADWKVVYRQNTIEHPNVFLCSNWAYHRLKDDLKPGDLFPPKEPSDDTTAYSVEDYVEKLENKFGLAVCDDDDPDRVCSISFHLSDFFFLILS
jgi:hypothetical protein